MENREERNFKEVIDQYAEQKKIAKKLQQEIDQKNIFIKEKLAKLGLTSYCTETSKVVLSEQNRRSFDEDKLIEILKANLSQEQLFKVVKTKLYVDYDELESAIYNDIISAKLLKPAEVVNTILTLKVSAVKKGKANE